MPAANRQTVDLHEDLIFSSLPPHLGMRQNTADVSPG
jgi:hypothetical protein